MMLLVAEAHRTLPARDLAIVTMEAAVAREVGAVVIHLQGDMVVVVVVDTTVGAEVTMVGVVTMATSMEEGSGEGGKKFTCMGFNDNLGGLAVCG